MSKKLQYSFRALFMAIPMLFLLASIIPVTHCSNEFTCDGDVGGITTEADCASYAAANDCVDTSFANGVCFVNDCLNCEVIVDDGDFVIDDVDDGDFFF